mmetsp:Transcript_37493/g.84544  ORF Transcript_37493/g.84544 Transcript_37493/m.84544 type:complete len:281 (-) Transcript_37493:974-1816(-)
MSLVISANCASTASMPSCPQSCLGPAKPSDEVELVGQRVTGPSAKGRGSPGKRSSRWSMRVRTYSRRSTTSRTVAPLPPRRRSTSSRNSPKLIFLSSIPDDISRITCLGVSPSSLSLSGLSINRSLFSNRMSLRDTRSSASTPKFDRIMCISGLRIRSSNSSLRMLRSSFLSWTSSMFSRLRFRYACAACSFSLLWTVVTTSQTIPISMLSTVKLLRKTKTRKRNVSMGDSSRTAGSSSATASRNVPCRSSHHMHSYTPLNFLLRFGSGSACVLKMIPKR